jgi:hypothetical protein
MAVRKAYRPDTSEQWRELYRKRRGRIYVLWLIGVVIGIVKLRPTSMSAGGLTFTIDRPEIIQGALYLGCLVIWFDTVATIIVKRGMIDRSDRRDAFFLALKPYRRSFKNLNPEQLKTVYGSARRILTRPLVVNIFEVSIPIAFVVVFGLPAIWQLIKVIVLGP